MPARPAAPAASVNCRSGSSQALTSFLHGVLTAIALSRYPNFPCQHLEVHLICLTLQARRSCTSMKLTAPVCPAPGPPHRCPGLQPQCSSSRSRLTTCSRAQQVGNVNGHLWCWHCISACPNALLACISAWWAQLCAGPLCTCSLIGTLLAFDTHGDHTLSLSFVCSVPTIRQCRYGQQDAAQASAWDLHLVRQRQGAARGLWAR